MNNVPIEKAFSLRTGDKIASFALPDVRGHEVSLDAILSERRVILLFYRGGWCPLCNMQLARLSEAYSEFSRRKIEILAISNEDVVRGRAVLQKLGPPYPLLLDQEGEVIRRFGLLVEKRDPLGWVLGKRGYAHPAAILIGQDRRVRWFYLGRTYRDRPKIEQLLEAADQNIES